MFGRKTALLVAASLRRQCSTLLDEAAKKLREDISKDIRAYAGVKCVKAPEEHKKDVELLAQLVEKNHVRRSGKR